MLAPNVRGSSGYGKSYLLLDNWYKREDSVKDIGALITWARQQVTSITPSFDTYLNEWEQPELDPERILVDGGSYGGYMVLASMIHFGEKLRCGIERVGISNFVTFLENTSSYRQDNVRDQLPPSPTWQLMESSTSEGRSTATRGSQK